ncbi:unnamed protein product, partial [Discosporangium mesarthrocarpum]
MTSTSEHPDYYERLDLQRAASDAEIKRAYRKLAMKWHPDKNKDNAVDAAKMFQDIGEAYDVLSDKERRAIFDQYGFEGLRDGVPTAGRGKPQGYSYKRNAQEIFEGFFGTQNPFVDFAFGDTMPFASRLNKHGPKKPDPVVRDLECTLEELFSGCTKTFRVIRQRIHAEGGLRDEEKELTVDVKPGWKKGTRITFPNEGDERPGVLPADVVLVVSEKPHRFFSREGNRLVYLSKMSLADALTDCIVEVPTLDGRVLRLPCPEVVSPGYERVIPGEGMPITRHRGERGDLILKFRLVFPQFLPDSKKV